MKITHPRYLQYNDVGMVTPAISIVYSNLFHTLWQECHGRAWQIVTEFIEQNLTQFAGKTSEAESTLMPSSRAWIRKQTDEMGNAPDDHCVMLFLNCPAIGVLSAARTSFILNYVTNVIADHPLNSICFIVHPNRAGQQEGRWGGSCVTHISMGHMSCHYFSVLEYM